MVPEGTRFHTLKAEFLTGSVGYRRVKGGGNQQQLAKAVGLKKRSKTLTIFDATAGLGVDAFLLAALGCQVRLVERSPIMAALLEDGLNRVAAVQDPALSFIHHMQLIKGDAVNILKDLQEQELPDVVYLDPMFPDRDQSALNKIPMRIIRQLVGEDKDVSELLHVALTCAKKRVVVKRPRWAPPLSHQKPTVIIPGKSNRFDIYLI